MSLFVVSGLSGAGKSTILKWLKDNDKLEPNSIIMDQDAYFYARQRKPMPMFTLSNGSQTTNYDSPDAIDNKQLEKDVNQYLSQGKNVYISGFMFRKNMYNLKPLIHFHLLICKDTSTYRRQNSKGYKDFNQQKKDKMRMDELIYPEYLKTLSNSKIHYFLDGTKPININAEYIRKKIHKKLK